MSHSGEFGLGVTVRDVIGAVRLLGWVGEMTISGTGDHLVEGSNTRGSHENDGTRLGPLGYPGTDCASTLLRYGYRYADDNGPAGAD